ncbi:MAG: fasciclin domain-containing protein [Paludibacter sp.]|jgi:hypothetical protein
MKYKCLKRFALLVSVIAALIVTSCTEEWNKHYSEDFSGTKSNLNLYELIKSKENLNSFTKLLEVSGYDSLLAEDQSFTVFAPDNNALKNIDLNDKVLATEIVMNYTARYAYSTSGIENSIIPMLNKKLLPFERNASNFKFNQIEIGESDLAAQNGILHIIKGYEPYNYNIWEYIYHTEGFDSLRTYVSSLSVEELDVNASYKNGVFVDSIFKTENKLLTDLALINAEDSIYTALLPNNEAWTEILNRVKSYYIMSDADGGVAKQNEVSKWAIIRNLFFRGKIDLPVSEKVLTSTGRVKFYNPDALFQDVEAYELSNGIVYTAGQLHIEDTASWAKPIIIEAENASMGRMLSNFSPQTLSSLGTGFDVSGKYYLGLNDASLNSLAKLHVTFPVPNVLSTKYNIYCVFVPRIILDENDERPYKVKFSLNYYDAEGKKQTGYIDADKNVQSAASAQATFITDPTKIDKFLITENFEFPHSNVVFDYETTAEFVQQIRFSVKVENDTKKTTAEQRSYSRDLLIDCIILEPVL